MEKDYPFDERPGFNKNGRKWYVWIFIALLAALILWSMAGEKITALFNGLLAGITPIIIALVISFLFLRPMNFIENKLMKNAFVGNPKAARFKRAISLSIMYLITIGLLVVIVVVAVPSIVSLVQQFTDQSQVDNLIAQLKQLVMSIVQAFGLSSESAVGVADTVVTAITDFIGNTVNSISIENVFGIGSTLLSVVMGLIISFFLLKDKELVAKTGRRYVYAYYPRRKAEEVLTITRRTKEMMNEYVVSTLLVCFAVFVVALIGYVIMGVPYAFMMALLLGILSIIPYIGGFIGAVPLLIVTLMAGDINLFLMAFIFSIAEWAIITTFLPALIMSKRMNTRTMIIFIALIVGGAMFGVIGMILSAPIASVVTIVLNEKLQSREALREHEELIEAGIIDSNFYDISEMLDLTQDNPGDIAIEKEEDDFKKLQALKTAKKEVDTSLDIVVSSKSSRKQKVDKKSIKKEPKTKEKNPEEQAQEILEES